MKKKTIKGEMIWFGGRVQVDKPSLRTFLDWALGRQESSTNLVTI